MLLEELMLKLNDLGDPTLAKSLQSKGINHRDFGVSMTKLKTLASGYKKDNALARDLIATGNFDAMRLAVFLADPKLMKKKDFDDISGVFYCLLTADAVLSKLILESSPETAFRVSSAFRHSPNDILSAAGWMTLSRLVRKYPDNLYWNYNLEKLTESAFKKFGKQSGDVKSARLRFLFEAARQFQNVRKEIKSQMTSFEKEDVTIHGKGLRQIPVYKKLKEL